MNWESAATIAITLISLAIIAIALKRNTKAKLIAKKPLTNVEQVLYLRLVDALPEHIVLAQVSFSRFLKPTEGTKKENWKMFASIKQKVADYLICKKDFSIVAVIELDDSTHNETRDAKRDDQINSAGLRMIRWNVKNLPNKEQIIKEISKEKL